MQTLERLQQAVALHKIGKLHDADQIYKSILENEPEQADALHLCGVIAQQQNQSEKAVELISKAIRFNPNHPPFFSNLGNAYRSLGKLDLAIESYDHALKLNPDFLDALVNRAAALADDHQIDDAKKDLQYALQIQPNHAIAHARMARIHHLEDKSDLAIETMKIALTLNPDLYEEWSNLGNILRDTGRPELAERMHRRAIQLNPEFFQAWNNLGQVLHDLHRFSEAIAAYDKAVEIAPRFIEPVWNKSLSLLTIGEYGIGFQLYEYRLKRAGVNVPQLSRPEWTGGDLKGKTLLVYAEQGYGDQFQYVRFLFDVAVKASKVILVVEENLRELMRSLEIKNLEVVTYSSLPNDYDCFTALMSIPARLRVQSISSPTTLPYLKADDDLADPIAQKLSGSKKMKVGFCWKGNPKHSNDRKRSINIEAMRPILDLDAFDFYSLQYQGESDFIHISGISEKIKNAKTSEDDLKNFSTTAALIQNLDLIITVDTSIAHLAGAMGRPVWLLVSRCADWRWGVDKTTTPWYPSMKIYRQSDLSTWADAIESIRNDLQHLTQ